MKTNKCIKKQKLKNNKLLLSIQGRDVLNTLFTYLPQVKKYQIIKKSKQIQSKLGITLNSYIVFSSILKAKKAFNPINDIIGLFTQIQNQTPSITQSELAKLLWSIYPWTKLKFFSSNSSLICLFLPFIKDANEIQIEIDCVCHKELLLSNDLSDISKELISQCNSLKYKYQMNKQISFTEAENLFKNINYIRYNSNKRRKIKLELSGFKTDIHFMQMLNELISKCDIITELSLSNNRINDITIKSLFSDIHLKNILNLDLSDNCLSDKSICDFTTAIASSKIERINLSHNCFKSEIIKEIAKFSNNIIEINLSANLVNNKCFEYFNECKENFSLIKCINISKNVIDYQCLSQFKKFVINYPQLEELYLPKIVVKEPEQQNEFLLQLCSLVNLRYLFIDELSFDNSTPTQFKKFVSQLDSITMNMCMNIENAFDNSKHSLSSINVEDSLNFQIEKFNSILLNCVSLKELNISNCKVNINDILSLLNHITNIEKLNVSNNIWTPNSLISFCECLSKYNNLKSFNISTSSSVSIFPQQNTKLVILSLMKCDLLNEIDFSYLTFDYEAFDYLLSLLRKNQNVSFLALRGCKITDENIKSLLYLNNFTIMIKKINLGNNPITQIGVEMIIEMRERFIRLNSLNLSQIDISKEIKQKLMKSYSGIVLC